MRSKEELTSLFTTYFSDRLLPSEIDVLVADVMSGIHNRGTRTHEAAISKEEQWHGHSPGTTE